MFSTITCLIIFLVLSILPWVANIFFDYGLIVFITTLITMAIYLINVIVFFWFMLKQRYHNQQLLMALTFGCISCLTFTVLKIDWLNSMFYLQHTDSTALMWLNAHIMGGFGHLGVQMFYVKKH